MLDDSFNTLKSLQSLLVKIDNSHLFFEIIWNRHLDSGDFLFIVYWYFVKGHLSVNHFSEGKSIVVLVFFIFRYI